MARRNHSNKRKDIEKRLRMEGWVIVRNGPGGHVQYKRADQPGRVTIDAGKDDIPTGTLRSIYRQAGWTW